MKKFIVSALIITLGFLLKHCNTTEPPPPNGEEPTLELTLEDVSCIEAWIKLTTTNLALPATLILYQDSVAQNNILCYGDTLLYVDSLLPNKNYQYQVSSIENPATSNELTVTTLDTTSHNFTFETFTFGGTAGSCALYDVSIINENYIIAVGTVFLNDSLGQPDPQPYGIAKWDGQNWELKKIFHSTNIPVTPRGILVISPNEIYLAAGSIFRWDGVSSTVQMVFSRLSLPDPNATIEKLWGNSSASIYGVGNVGSIVFYNGTLWSRIESGTEVNINDVFGVINQKNDNKQIFCATSFVLELGDHKILTIDQNNNVDSLHWDTGRRVNSTWSKNGWIVYTSGGGVFNNKSGRWKEEISIPLYYTNRIRGNGLNDIFAVGDFALLAHFNGADWRIYQDLLQLPLTSFNSITVKENIISIVGYSGEKALVIIGNRN